MKTIIFFFSAIFCFSVAHGSNCQVYIEYSKPCINQLDKVCETVTDYTFDEKQLVSKGYIVVPTATEAGLIFKSTFFGYEPKLLTGDSSSGYSQSLKLTETSTGRSLERFGSSRSLFGASRVAVSQAWESFPTCSSLSSN